MPLPCCSSTDVSLPTSSDEPRERLTDGHKKTTTQSHATDSKPSTSQGRKNLVNSKTTIVAVRQAPVSKGQKKSIEQEALNEVRLKAANQLIRQAISSTALLLVTKSWCPNCRTVEGMLEGCYELNLSEHYKNLQLDRGGYDQVAILEYLAESTNGSRAIPKVFLGGVHVEVEKLIEMHHSGDLGLQLGMLGVGRKVLAADGKDVTASSGLKVEVDLKEKARSSSVKLAPLTAMQMPKHSF